ncbi:dihydroorotate dehydrogenase-like protein [bacterium]|nr:dihydroorotate dehydrogenase-like protein [bacterium]
MQVSTEYLGLTLRNPLIAASCSLSKDLDGIKKLADSGVGAIVLKSLFEEQMDMETRDIEQYIGPAWHTEARDYVRNMGMQLGPRQYVDLVKKAKSAVSIPVIASLNCISENWWYEYAHKLEVAGADALELNIGFLPGSPGQSGREVEETYFRIVENVKATCAIPFAVKLGFHFSALPWFAWQLADKGAGALVLFNRFYQADIDIDAMKLRAGNRLSGPEESHLPLRWISLLYGKIGAGLSASTGAHSAAEVIKLLLAGACTVQLCSTLYKNSLTRVQEIIDGLQAWMSEHSFSSISDFRGLLSHEKMDDPGLWERLQYIKALVGIE